MLKLQHVAVSQQKDVTVATFQVPRLVGDLAIAKVGEELYSLADRPECRKLLLNFSCVEHLSSEMLGKLLSLNKRMEQKGGAMRLCALRPEIREIFALTRLDQVLDLRDTEIGGVLAFG